jgi:hypothetical protein
MKFAKPILVAVAAIMLAVYEFDCDSMTTPEQAMQCCASMPCSPQGHRGQDCCKAMPSMHVPFVQPLTPHAGFSFVVLAVLPDSSDSIDLMSSARHPASDSHAPPLIYSSSPVPLRI